MVEADDVQFPVVPIEVDVPGQAADVHVQADVPGPNPIPAEPAREPVTVAARVEQDNLELSNYFFSSVFVQTEFWVHSPCHAGRCFFCRWNSIAQGMKESYFVLDMFDITWVFNMLCHVFGLNVIIFLLETRFCRDIRWGLYYLI